MSEGFEKPIFIVGSARSGTTILWMMLDSHPNISCAYETEFLVEFFRMERQWRKKYEALGYDRSYWLDRTRDFYARFHEDRASRRNKSRWCEKTPVYVFYLKFIKELFPDAQIIHIVRDGRAVVQSFFKRWGWRGAVRATRRWGRCVDAARAFAEQYPEQYIEVKYEDLVTDSETVMRGLLDFLGEPWDDIVLSPYDVHKPSQGLRGKQRELADREGSKGIHTSGLDGGRDLNLLLRRLLYQRSGDQMRLLNYL